MALHPCRRLAFQPPELAGLEGLLCQSSSANVLEQRIQHLQIGERAARQACPGLALKKPLLILLADLYALAQACPCLARQPPHLILRAVNRDHPKRRVKDDALTVLPGQQPLFVVQAALAE